MPLRSFLLISLNWSFNCSGLDLLACDAESKSLNVVETRKLNVSWYVYTHESRLVLLASGMQCKTFSGFQVCQEFSSLASTLIGSWLNLLGCTLVHNISGN
jgi:hypothetical protein